MGNSVKKRPSKVKGIRKPNSAQKRVDLSPTVKKRRRSCSSSWRQSKALQSRRYCYKVLFLQRRAIRRKRCKIPYSFRGKAY